MNWIAFPLLMIWVIRGVCQVDSLIVTTSESDPKQVFLGDTIRAQPLNIYRRCTDVTQSATSYTIWVQKGISSTVPVTFDSRSIPLAYNIYAVNGAGRLFLPVPWCTSSIFDQSSDELKHLSIDMLSAQYNFYRSKGYNQYVSYRLDQLTHLRLFLILQIQIHHGSIGKFACSNHTNQREKKN